MEMTGEIRTTSTTFPKLESRAPFCGLRLLYSVAITDYRSRWVRIEAKAEVTFTSRSRSRERNK